LLESTLATTPTLKSDWSLTDVQQPPDLHARWIRSVVPVETGKRVVLLDPAMWTAAVVEPGMTENAIRNAWNAEPPMPADA